MTGREKFILGSSFVMGTFTGLFFYTTVFTPLYEKQVDVIGAPLPNAITIEGKMYGGCQKTDSCGSFKLKDTRSYQYLPDSQSEVEKGTIPSTLRDVVFNSMTVAVLDDLEKDAAAHECSAYIDGIDYLYDVTIASTTYTLDTCSSRLSNNTTLQAHFITVWEFMENPTTTYPTMIEKGPIQMLFDRFNRNVDDQNNVKCVGMGC